MTIFKNSLALFASVVIGSAFIGGCNSSSNSASETTGSTSAGTTSEPTAKKFKIGVSIPAADHGWTAGLLWWANETVAKHPDVEFLVETADSPEDQVKDLETMMASGVQGVVVLATESAPITPVAKQLHDRGILIVNVDRGFTEPVAHVFIEGDNKGFGAKAAEFMAEKLGGKGNVVVLEGVPCTVNTDRNTAFKEVMAKFPEIKILDSQSGKWSREASYTVMQTLLLKNKSINAVWAADDDMALGAEKAIREVGRENEMWLVGGGGMKEVIKMVMDGNPMYPATVTYSPKMIVDGIERAVTILSGPEKDAIMKAEQKHEVIPVELITKENASKYYVADAKY